MVCYRLEAMEIAGELDFLLFRILSSRDLSEFLDVIYLQQNKLVPLVRIGFEGVVGFFFVTETFENYIYYFY